VPIWLARRASLHAQMDSAANHLAQDAATFVPRLAEPPCRSRSRCQTRCSAKPAWPPSAGAPSPAARARPRAAPPGFLADDPVLEDRANGVEPASPRWTWPAPSSRAWT